MPQRGRQDKARNLLGFKDDVIGPELRPAPHLSKGDAGRRLVGTYCGRWRGSLPHLRRRGMTPHRYYLTELGASGSALTPAWHWLSWGPQQPGPVELHVPAFSHLLAIAASCFWEFLLSAVAQHYAPC